MHQLKNKQQQDTTCHTRRNDGDKQTRTQPLHHRKYPLFLRQLAVASHR